MNLKSEDTQFNLLKQFLMKKKKIGERKKNQNPKIKPRDDYIISMSSRGIA